MAFVETGHSPIVRGIVFLFIIVGACVQNWTAVNLARALYEEVPIDKKTLVNATLITVVLYNVIIYAGTFLNGFRKFDGWQTTVLIIPNPLTCIVVYALITKLWKFPGLRLANIMRHVYLYTLALSTTGLLMSKICTSLWGDMGDEIGTVLFLGLCLLFYRVGLRIIKHKNFTIHIASSMPIEQLHLLGLSLFSGVGVYVCTLFILPFFDESVAGVFIVAGSLLLILMCDILLTHKVALEYEFENKNSYIGSLVRTVDEYIHLRQELENILGQYDSYLEEDDLTAITHYHESLMGKTTLTLQSITVAQKISQNPSLVALLMQKIDYAHRMDVHILIPTLCSVENMYMENFDLGRLLGNLLNNAIEAAALSRERKVALTIAQKNPACKLIVITNSTANQVDIDDITQHGTSTKDNHMGIGLTQVRNIVRKYANCMVNFACENQIFSVYIELRM